MKSSPLPSSVVKYFWGDDLSDLSLEKHEKYILQTILELGDRDAVRWLLSNFDRTYIKEQLPSMKLTPKSANFWNVYLA